MPKISTNPKNVYEIMENDDGEILLLLYANEYPPQKATFLINEKKKNLELNRGPNDIVILDGLATESIIKLKKIDKLYICEMKYNENPNDENEIVYAYTATIKEQNTSKEKEITLSDKAKKAREKILKNT